jgi:transglutaminase-like putative cysteine protease
VTTPLRLAAFAALGAWATAHWARMVENPPLGALALAVVLAVGLGAALALLERVPLSRVPARGRRPALHVAAAVAALACGALALMAVGLEARLLAPGGWAELADELDRGLAGVRTVDWPYAGDEQSVRETILLLAPLLLCLGAALVFWPARRGGSLRSGLGLAAVLVLYGVAVTEHDPGAPLPRGLVLLALVGAWLWLPRLRGREAAVGAAVVASFGLFAMPVAAKLDSGRALVDYRSWTLFGGKDITFDWNHSYGPLDWPRDGTTLLNVDSDRPLYWKAETLDAFDGLRWLRSPANSDTQPLAELPSDPEPRWQRTFDVSVRSLRTDFVIAAGTPFEITGVGEPLLGSADGTVSSLDDPLRSGDTYTVEAYVPDPSAERLRRASTDYESAFGQYTRVGLPRPGETALPEDAARGDASRSAAPPARFVEVALWDGSGLADATIANRFDDSPYSRTYALARRLVDGQPTVYDAVANVEQHLERSYSYSETPPSQEYPLDSFLFDDRVGYCQQFSGAMALMLRMNGIPARVVSGFSPGSLNRDTGEYRVRDLDAHSWVEVHFPEIGWVTFDPTPTAAPAQRTPRSLATDRGGAGAVLSDSGSAGAAGSERALDGASGGIARGEQGGTRSWPLLAGLTLLAALAGGVAALHRRRRRAIGGGSPADQRLRELEWALPALGWSVPAGTTLLELERRLGRAAGPAAASYVARLRAGRFAGGGSGPVGAAGSADGASQPPGAAERRALRRALTAGRGPGARLRALLALPPAAPRFRRG